MFGVRSFRSYAELIEESEAVDFAVPPAAQAPLAAEAAAAGRALLLEKPLAASLNDAIELTTVINASGVANIVNLTKRYHQRTREFLARVGELPNGVRALTGRYVHGGFLETGFLDPAARDGWRTTLGALFDLGPHILDLADAVAGAVSSISVAGDLGELVSLTTIHDGGAIGQFLLSGRVATEDVLTDIDVYANEAHVAYTTRGLEPSEAVMTFRSEFVAAVRLGTAVTVDAHRALALQRVLHASLRSYEAGHAVQVE